MTTIGRSRQTAQNLTRLGWLSLVSQYTSLAKAACTAQHSTAQHSTAQQLWGMQTDHMSHTMGSQLKCASSHPPTTTPALALQVNGCLHPPPEGCVHHISLSPPHHLTP
jgi:hypothetical protein